MDNTAVRQAQIARLQQLRANRDDAAVDHALHALTKRRQRGDGNLLELSVKRRARGPAWAKFSMRWKRFGGGIRPSSAPLPACTAASMAKGQPSNEVRRWPTNLPTDEGRRPRILVAKIGQDGHDRGAKVIATAFADLGFDVDIGPLFQTPEEVARQAVENDVHVVGMSSLAAGHKTLLPQLVAELAKLGREDIMVVIGGVIPAQDYEFLVRSRRGGHFWPRHGDPHRRTEGVGRAALSPGPRIIALIETKLSDFPGYESTKKLVCLVSQNSESCLVIGG